MTNKLDLFFGAMSDPTRRAVIEHLASGPATVSALHAPHKMALPTFMRHLKVLEESGIVRSIKKGACAPAIWHPRPWSKYKGGWLGNVHYGKVAPEKRPNLVQMVVACTGAPQETLAKSRHARFDDDRQEADVYAASTSDTPRENR